MFSVRQKREIAEAVQRILRETKHPELPEGEISFHLHVDGAESWSWADIRNNGAVSEPAINPHNEAQDLDAEATYEAGAYVKTDGFELLIAVGHGPTEHAARKKLSAELHRLDRGGLRYSGSARRIKVIRRRGEKIEEISMEDWT